MLFSLWLVFPLSPAEKGERLGEMILGQTWLLDRGPAAISR